MLTPGLSQSLIEFPQDRRIRKAIDRNILPILIWVYWLQILDKSLLGYASIFGLQADAVSYTLLDLSTARLSIEYPFTETRRKAILFHRLNGADRSNLLATVLVILDCASQVAPAHGVGNSPDTCQQPTNDLL